MLLEQADLLCRHYVLIWMLPSRWYLPVFSVKCEMWSCWHFVYLRILNSIRLSTKLFINQSQPPRYTSILVHRSLGRSPHEVWMVERSTPARKRLAKMEYHGSIKSTKSTCEKDNHIMTTASCSTRTFSAYVCIPYSVCQQGPSIKRSLSYQTQRSYHSKSMELIWKKNLHTRWKQHFAGQSSKFKLLGNKFSNISFLDVFFWICTIFFSIRFVFLGTFYTSSPPPRTSPNSRRMREFAPSWSDIDAAVTHHISCTNMHIIYEMTTKYSWQYLSYRFLQYV